MAMTRAHVFFSGKVQGVYFRANTCEKARDLGLKGWVRNLPDGRVEAVFEGPRDMVEEAVEYCSRGQPYASVENVEISWEDALGETDFSIESDGAWA